MRVVLRCSLRHNEHAHKPGAWSEGARHPGEGVRAATVRPSGWWQGGHMDDDAGQPHGHTPNSMNGWAGPGIRPPHKPRITDGIITGPDPEPAHIVGER